MPRHSQKDKILDAALQCFAKKGYGNTRIREIAEMAEVSEAALYRHFESKEAVAQTLFAHHFQEFAMRLKKTVSAQQPADNKLQDVVHLLLNAYRENPSAFNFVILNTPSFMPQLPADTVYPMDILEQIIKAGQMEGGIRDGQPNLLAAIFLGCVLRPVIVSQLADPDGLNLLQGEHYDQVIVEAALAAVRRPA
ncbi:MAG: TetR/AcrR family transcriptional regulator [Chloroflexi bacterium]|nr:TetR/AcrR family transcriptional regulator [Chloroflexota bacterium]